MEAIDQVLLPSLTSSLIIFVDEIDAIRSLDFSTDEFFASIRACYNRRSEEPQYTCLAFCLLGVAVPSDLIRDTRMSPFNIGRRILLTDFTAEEAAPLAAGLRISPHSPQKPHLFPTMLAPTEESLASSYLPLRVPGDEMSRREPGVKILARVLYWTGGHPDTT